LRSSTAPILIPIYDTGSGTGSGATYHIRYIGAFTLTRVDGHASWANSAALKEAGIETPPAYTVRVPATVEFSDLAAPGGGSGAQTLVDVAAYKNADALVHVVRAFQDPAIPHPSGTVNRWR